MQTATCPLDALRDPFVVEALEIHELMVSFGGALPARGGLLDQPAKLIDALAVLEGEKPYLESLIRADEARLREREVNRGRRKV